jgi:hypothetical protein
MFDPFESALLIDELHKLFQKIDQNGKGYLHVDEILEFQEQIAKSKIKDSD